MKVILLRLVTVFAVVVPIATCLTSCAPFPWSEFPNLPFSNGLWSLIGLVGLVLYVLPIIIGAVRQKENMLGIVLLNILGGWTVIGWIVALVWSFSPDR